MRGFRASFLLALAAAVSLAADADPWDVPAPSGIDISIALTTSKKSYTLMLADKPWEGANGAAHVELPLSKDEKGALTRCRELVDKGDHAGAVAAIDDVVAKNPADWDAYFVRALSRHATKADAEAAAALRTSLVGNRRNPDAWKLLEDVAKALGKKVARPKVDLRGWVRDLPKDEIEYGFLDGDKACMPWHYYGAARALYRGEGQFARDFPDAKAYVFTFREQMFAMGVLAASAADEKKEGKSLPADLLRVLAEKKAGTLAPFAFFAAYPEPLTATPEKGFDALRPRLEKYFDEKILVKR